MNIYITKHGYRAEVQLGDGRRKTKSGFKRKLDAQNWIREIENANKDPDKRKESDETFDKLLARYKTAHLTTLRKTTQLRYLTDINDRIEPFFRYMRLNTITKKTFRDFRVHITETNDQLQPASVNKALELVRSIMNFAVEDEMLKANPFKLKKLKVGAKRFQWWQDQEDIRRFLNTAREMYPKYYAAYRLALDLGLRAGEVNGLSKRDIDFQRCQINVHRQWCDDTKQYEPLKDNECRTLPWDIKSDLADVLREAVRISPHVEALFVTGKGQRIMTNKLSFDLYRRIRDMAKVPPIRFHDLRHTFASWYVQNGGNLRDLMYMLGHSDLAMVQKYAHARTDHLRRVSFEWQDKDTQNSHNETVGMAAKVQNLK